MQRRTRTTPDQQREEAIDGALRFMRAQKRHNARRGSMSGERYKRKYLYTCSNPVHICNHAMDRVSIYFPLIMVRPELVTSPPAPWESELSGRKYNHEHGRSVTYWTLSFANRSLELKIISLDDEEYFINQLSFNPCRLLYGHNAAMIRSHEEFLVALAGVHEMLSKLLGIKIANLMIPGLVEGSGSHWAGIEIATQIADPGGKIFSGMRDLRHHLVKKPMLSVKGESYALKGKKLCIQVYNKHLEISRKRVHPGYDQPHETLRIETKPMAGHLAYFVCADASAKLAGWKDQRLITFRFEDLFQAHQRVLSEAKGLYYQDSGNSEASKLNNVLAKFSLLSAMPVGDIVSMMRTDGVWNKETSNRNRNQINRILDSHKSVRLVDIAPLDSGKWVDALAARHSLFPFDVNQMKHQPIYAELARVYSSSKSEPKPEGRTAMSEGLLPDGYTDGIRTGDVLSFLKQNK